MCVCVNFSYCPGPNSSLSVSWDGQRRCFWSWSVTLSHVHSVSSPGNTLLLNGPGPFPAALSPPGASHCHGTGRTNADRLASGVKRLRPDLLFDPENNNPWPLLSSGRCLAPAPAGSSFSAASLMLLFSRPSPSPFWVSFGRHMSAGTDKGIAFTGFRCWQHGEVCYAGSLKQQTLGGLDAA